jgi:hypothetical protein
LHCGATENDLENIEKLAKTQSYELEGKISSPMPLDSFVEKVASKDSNLSEAPLKSHSLHLKLAASLKDKSTADAVLALGLSRQKNLQQYLAMLPTFEEMLSSLAKILLGARIGVNRISPDTAKEAVDSLSTLVEELQVVAASEKKS